MRLQSNRRLLITRYQILENAFTLRFNAYSLALMVHIDINLTLDCEASSERSEDDSLDINTLCPVTDLL